MLQIRTFVELRCDRCTMVVRSQDADAKASAAMRIGEIGKTWAEGWHIPENAQDTALRATRGPHLCPKCNKRR